MNYTAKGIASNELYMGPNNLAEFASGQDQFSLLGANLKVDPRHQLEQLITPQMVVSAGGVVVGITAVSAENICTTSNCLVNRVPMLSAVPVEAALTGAIGFMLNRGSTLVVVIASGCVPMHALAAQYACHTPTSPIRCSHNTTIRCSPACPHVGVVSCQQPFPAAPCP